MDFLATFLILLISAAFAGIILATPRFLIRPRLRERFEQLRDEVYDGRRSGQLPFDHPAIDSLIERAETATELVDELTFARVAVVLWLSRSVSEEEKSEISALVRPQLDGLDSEQIKLYQKYDQRFYFLIGVTPLFGTWLGIAVSMVSAPIVPIIIGILALSSRFHVKAEDAQGSYLGRRVEEAAYELNQEPLLSRPRRHFIGV